MPCSRDSASDCPFLTWEWLHTWWTHLGGSSRLRIAAVRAGQELVALAPFRITKSRVALLSRVDMLGTGEAGSDYLDVIVRRGREAEASAALAQFATSENTTLRFDHLPPTSMAGELARQLSGEGWASVSAADGTCPFIRWPATRGIRISQPSAPRTAPTSAAGYGDSGRSSRCASSG